MNALQTTTIDPSTEIGTVAPIAKPRGKRRTRLASILFAAIVGIGMFGTQAAVTEAASAGPYDQAYATCNFRNHTITLIAQAGAAPGYLVQTIYYRYWVYDASTGRYVQGLNPTNYGSIVHRSSYVSGGITYINNGTTNSAPSVFALPPGHRYMVITEYWWNMGNQWLTASVTTSDYGNVGNWSDPTVRSNNGCIA